jgi:DNA polymerase-3 subunit epsilon
LETTGIGEGHRIIEIAIVTICTDTWKVQGRLHTLVDPMRSIDAKAQAVHGIAYDQLVGAPVWEAVANAVRNVLLRADVIVAHNADFDLPFIAGELARVGLTPPDIPSFCTMESGRWATFDGKSPRLEELCWTLDVPYDRKKAHGALYDVVVTLACLRRGMEKGFYQLPQVAKQLQAA